MPWCERCDRFLSPNTVTAEGTCPSCGRTIDPVEPTPRPAGDGTAAQLQTPLVEEAESVKAPWHFWVMVIAAVGYLAWRAVEAVVWLLRTVL